MKQIFVELLKYNIKLLLNKRQVRLPIKNHATKNLVPSREIIRVPWTSLPQASTAYLVLQGNVCIDSKLKSKHIVHYIASSKAFEKKQVVGYSQKVLKNLLRVPKILSAVRAETRKDI